MPSVLPLVKVVGTESLLLPRVPFDKAVFCRVPDKRHSAKLRTFGKEPDSDTGCEHISCTKFIGGFCFPLFNFLVKIKHAYIYIYIYREEVMEALGFH
jgi:hypothetical protein